MRDVESGWGGRGDTVAPSRLRALLTSRPTDSGAAVSDPAVPPPPGPERPPGRPWAGRWALEPSGARALVAVGIAAALAAAGFLWLARPRYQPVPAPAVRPSLAGPPAIATTSPSATALVVDVAGKVRRPGVVTLSPGARVIDAIAAAGGLRPGAGPGAVNLARHVVDGEQILVGTGGAAQPPAVPAAPGTPGPAAPGSAPGAPLDLNVATVEQFDALPGVGPVLARRIVDYRTQHGGFRSVDELQEVTGIGARKYADIKDLVRV
ncbi:MAG TPA: ComEA family DNA-binding protein [Streptosporangiaceae bacterium]